MGKNNEAEKHKLTGNRDDRIANSLFLGKKNSNHSPMQEKKRKCCINVPDNFKIILYFIQLCW